MYTEIIDRLHDGQRLMIPCAEKGQLQDLLATLQALFPHKKFAVLHGDLGREEKCRVLRELRATRRSLADPTRRETTHKFDAVLYNSTMDCGVSIENEDGHYSACVFLLNNRSINADVAMQMVCRCRRYSRGEVVYLCSPGVRDFERNPGYRHEKASEVPDGYVPLVYASLSQARHAMQQECWPPAVLPTERSGNIEIKLYIKTSTIINNRKVNIHQHTTSNDGE